MTARSPITKDGFQKVQDELKNLISVERQKVIQDIAEARAHGDLKENAEYHAAKEKQSHIETRIQQLNNIIATAEIVDTSNKCNTDKIQFGAIVEYEDLDTGKSSLWQIVGNEEGDAKQNKISIQSPIAKALLGKKEGDTVNIKIPKGNMEVEIVSVRYR